MSKSQDTTSHRVRARGFTLIEAIVVMICVIAVIALVGIMLPALGRRTNCSSTLEEAMQIRAIIYAAKTWTDGNKGMLPLPSSVDSADTTVSELGRAKDTTANLHSMLIYEQSITPELVVAPLECNSNIRVKQDYEYSRPRAALSPTQALWDPAFSADFKGSTPGNVSFANLQPAGSRLGIWSRQSLRDSRLGGTALVSSRGPEIVGFQTDNQRARTASYAIPQSMTLCDSASFRARWEGNVGFVDGHVEWFKKDFGPIPYKTASDRPNSDALFFDELDDPAAANTFLGIFIRAGETPAEYKAIWD